MDGIDRFVRDVTFVALRWALIALALVVAVGFISCQPAVAEAQGSNCADHEIVVERLLSSYGESRQAIGIGADNTVVEVFASLEFGTWSILVTQAGGLTRLVAAGEAFQLTPNELTLEIDPIAWETF